MARRATLRLPPALSSPAAVATAADGEGVRRTYTKRQWEQLLAGDIVSAARREADGQHAEAAGIVACPPRALWPLLVDFESRPAYLPGAQEVRILKIAGTRVWLAERVKILFVTIAYQVVNTLDPAAGTVAWVLDDTAAHDIAATAGSWQLVPVAGGRQTLVRYRNVLDSGQPIPGAIERVLLNRSLPQMIGGLRAEAERRAG
jgi:hypothetical protein